MIMTQGPRVFDGIHSAPAISPFDSNFDLLRMTLEPNAEMGQMGGTSQ